MSRESPPGNRAVPEPEIGGIAARALLNAEQVAEILAVPVSWVRAETRAGRIPHLELGRYRRYRLEALEAWLAEQERGA